MFGFFFKGSGKYRKTQKEAKAIKGMITNVAIAKDNLPFNIDKKTRTCYATLHHLVPCKH
ncbi:hypothetical protein APR41_15890 [Salegentibacter salinarum]|uniref:Uncharacterized protein n=1 Tax=Salegentibacter salinarum TaxID=447422 RepID=A0A2N0TXI8_9FLAO|nr:hypothetical protein APR41_15890 [Salegentibacter salinarum]